MIQDKDLYIFDLYKPSDLHILNCWHILVDNLVGYQYIEINKSKKDYLRQLDTVNWVHKVMVDKDLFVVFARVYQLKTNYLSITINVNAYGIYICNLLQIGWQRTNGSPVYLTGQLHIGLWLTTVHLAPTPHVPGQGSIHFWLEHASFWAHSALTTHSGRQVGGLPKYPGTHEQTACPLISRHWLFGPQGEGLHGFWATGATNFIF